MIALRIRLLAGRYHATPWDRGVNEGTVEWPPSPWRILRALVAAAYKVTPMLSPERVRAALEPLRELPSYHLPPATASHVRAYLPLAEHRAGMLGGTSKIFDAFAATEKGAEVVCVWPNAAVLDLDDLRAIAAALSYLGRAESWVEVDVLGEWSGHPNAVPAPGDARGGHRVRLLSLASEAELAQLRQRLMSPAAPSEEPERKRHKKAARPPRQVAAIPEDWWAALHLDTEALYRAGWSSPPGATWASYVLDHEPFSPRVRPRRLAPLARPTLARFALTSAVLPARRLALPLGERMRQATMSWSRESPAALRFFSGKDERGTPLRGDRHAYFLAADDDGDGRLDHILVWAAEGIPPDAVKVLQSLRKLWGEGGHDLHLQLVALGRADHPGMDSRCCAASRTWISFTPFVPPRHAKRRHGEWLDTAEDEVRRLLGVAGYPTPSEVEPLPARWSAFVHTRRGGGARGGRCSGFRLRFEQPVAGPIVIGYGAHQGLGQFRAAQSSD